MSVGEDVIDELVVLTRSITGCTVVKAVTHGSLARTLSSTRSSTSVSKIAVSVCSCWYGDVW